MVAFLLALLTVIFFLYARSERKIDRANELRLRSVLLAEDLRQSSDDLTRMARTFVATGDPLYEKAYRDLLEIREGRLSSAHLSPYAHWILDPAEDPCPPRENQPAISFLDEMRAYQFAQWEFDMLAAAKAKSDELTRREFEAMDLARAAGPDASGDRLHAIALLHDESYHRAKHDIIFRIDEFIRMVDERTLRSVKRAERKTTALRYVFIALGMGLFYLLWSTHRALRATLGGSLEDVYRRIEELGGGHLPEPQVVPAGAEDSVLGWLAETRRKLIRMEEDRRRAETEQDKLHAQLLQAHKMEVVGRLAGGVAHEFNNKLQIIMGFSDLMSSRVREDPHLREPLAEIHKAAQHSAELTRQLLAYARKQLVAPKVLDLNREIERAVKMLKQLLGENIVLEWVPGDGLWPICADATQLVQILSNLSLNARDAMEGSGVLKIATGNQSFAELQKQEPEDVPAGDYVELLVEDTGHGMDEETLKHLFEPFFTTKDVGRGTGLGLATVYGIVKHGGGFIRVDSTVGRGTTFHILWPRAQRSQEVDETPDREQLAIGGGTETILLVEDEPAVLRFCQKILEEFGYQVLATSVPVDAISIARRHEGAIHLLISDVMMPEMNGLDLKNELASIRPGLRTLFISGHASDVLDEQGLLDPAVRVLKKPFKANELADLVRSVLDGTP